MTERSAMSIAWALIAAMIAVSFAMSALIGVGGL